MNESTMLPVERLLGAWARQSSGTRCWRSAEEMGSRNPCEAPHWFRGIGRSTPELVPAAISNLAFTIDPRVITIDR